jgi:hypothetical protein
VSLDLIGHLLFPMKGVGVLAATVPGCSFVSFGEVELTVEGPGVPEVEVQEAFPPPLATPYFKRLESGQVVLDRWEVAPAEPCVPVLGPVDKEMVRKIKEAFLRAVSSSAACAAAQAETVPLSPLSHAEETVVRSFIRSRYGPPMIRTNIIPDPEWLDKLLQSLSDTETGPQPTCVVESPCPLVDLQRGVMTVNEARARRDLPPIDPPVTVTVPPDDEGPGPLSRVVDIIRETAFRKARQPGGGE